MPTRNERNPRKRPSNRDNSRRGRVWEYAPEPERGRPPERERVSRREPMRERPQERVSRRERPQEHMSRREPMRERPQERVSRREPVRERPQERERAFGRERPSDYEPARKRPQKRGREPVRKREAASRRARTPERERVSGRGAVQERERVSRREAAQERGRVRTPERERKPRRKVTPDRRPPQNRRRVVRRRRKSRENWLSFLTRAAALFLLLFALGKIGNGLLFQELTVVHTDEHADAGDTAAPPVTPPDTKTVAAALPDIAAIAPDKSDRARKDKFYTILMAGVDDHNGGSDTVILVAVDGKQHRIFGMSIPRDTKAVIDGKAYKINAAYKIGGMELLAKTVSEQTSIPVDYTVEIDLNGFAALIDAVGGIDFDVPLDMDYEDPKQNLEIHVSKGKQHLDGETALKVVRFRHNSDGTGYGNEDLGRIQTQQNFLKTAARSLISFSTLMKLDDFVRIFQKYVKTELTLQNLAWLAKEAVCAGADHIQFGTLPGTWKSPYIYTDAESALALINERLNPYKTDRTLEDLKFPS